MAVGPVGGADPDVLTMECIHQHDRKHEAEEGWGEYTALIHSVGHCKRFGERFPRRAPSLPVQLTHHVRESFGTGKFPHDFPQSIAIHRIEGLCQAHEGSVGMGLHLLTLLSQLEDDEDHVGASVMVSESPLTSRQKSLFKVTVKTAEKDASEDLAGDVE
ncbi:Peptidyl-prolyl isomerase cwc27 [Sparganum proliferum]